MRSPFGFVTMALGRRAYLEMAVDMALSLRVFHDEPICLVCDPPLAKLARSHFAGVFDLVVPLGEDLVAFPAAKFHLAKLVPFDAAFFIDADVIVLNRLDREIWQTQRQPMTLIGSFLKPGSGERHHGIKVDDLMNAFGLDRYFTNHSGAFGYRREDGANFFAEALDVYQDLFSLKWRLKGFIGNELALGVVNGRRGIPPMVEPFPIIWPEEMARMTPGQTRTPLLHFIDMPPDDVFQWVMSDAKKRREAQNLPWHNGIPWVGKGRRSERTRLGLRARVASHLQQLSALNAKNRHRL